MKNRRRQRQRYALWSVLLLWFILMAPLTFWGLPSSKQDYLLYSGEPPWKMVQEHAARVAQQLRERQGGADTDFDPLVARDQIVDLTTDDAARAAILLRYRLYSRQPDEMITFRALQRMKPRQFDFDPKLYQYGGGYIYLIGAALGVSSLLGFTHLTGDIGYYLSQPEQFGRFYIVARLVTLVFGAFLLAAVYQLAARAAGRTAGWIALACVACCPVFITGALEAKPHLPAACMTLWAILSALDYQARGRFRDVLKMGMQAGYAMGLVLTGIAAGLLWPALLLAGSAAVPRRRIFRDLALAGALAVAVYAVTNPFIPYNLLRNRGALSSNLGNSTAMYKIGPWGDGATNVAWLFLDSAGPLVPAMGFVGLIWFLTKRPHQTILVAASGLALLFLCVALGAGKPAEFARFLLLPTVLLVIGCTWGMLCWRTGPLNNLFLIIGVSMVWFALGCIRSFYVDGIRTDKSRPAKFAAYLQMTPGPRDIGVLQEPAPYAVPPLDFTHDRIRLLPQQKPRDLNPTDLPRWLIFTADDEQAHQRDWWQDYYRLETRFPNYFWLLPSRIPWANKPVFLYQRSLP